MSSQIRQPFVQDFHRSVRRLPSVMRLYRFSAAKLFPVFPGFHSAQSKVPKDLRCRFKCHDAVTRDFPPQGAARWFSTTRSTLMPVPRS